MLFGVDIIRDLDESLDHTCESKIGHVKVDKGGFTVYISGIAKYDRGIVSQSLQYNNWHENILKISSLVDAHQTGNLVGGIDDARLKFRDQPSEPIINGNVGRGLQVQI
jgi:hypothetical protein